jgi:DNA polymerase-4
MGIHHENVFPDLFIVHHSPFTIHHSPYPHGIHMRSVLFIDPPAFCTTLEELVEPRLRSRPLAVAPPGADRATILALSAEARREGLTRGMPVRHARRICPDLIVLPPNPRLYTRASSALLEIFRVFAPAIEPRGYGHAFLDLTGTGGLFGPPEEVAARIRREASDRLRLQLSVGVAGNKLVSQAATTVAKQENDTLVLRVTHGTEPDFLAPYPIDVLPELDPGIRARLDDYQLDLIGEVAAIPETALCAVFGRHGRTLRARARGIDPRPVLPPELQTEFHVTHTLATDTNDLGVLGPLLRAMSERLGRRLRARGLTAGRLRLVLTYADYTVASRALPLGAAVLDAELHQIVGDAFALANTKRLAVRTLSLTLDRLMERDAQLTLWELSSDASASPASPLPRRPAALQDAIDDIRSRYGTGAVRGGPRTAYRSPLVAHQVTTTLPNVSLPSRARWASAS